MQTLQNAGHAAYLVGGCVRDMLLGHEPKDFDVTTDASPEQVKELFRSSRLIGRRFRLVHVRFGRDIIEVATFRGQHAGDAEGGVIEDGLILRDNVFGTIEEDAWRRDFSVNALFYDSQDDSVIDYVGGYADLKNGLLRILGEPEVRYREDPVRMLRAARFAAKLGFIIHAESEQVIAELAPLLRDVSPSRLFEEVLKLFQTGLAVHTFELMRHYNLFAQLFPETDQCLSIEVSGYPLRLLVKALTNTDERISLGKPVTPAFLFAAILWEPLRSAAKLLRAEGMGEAQSIQVAARTVLAQQSQSVILPKRFSLRARDVWSMQPRLERNSGKRALLLLQHPSFRAAYDFLLLRAESGEELGDLPDWWTKIQTLDEDERPTMLRASGDKPKRRRRRARRKKPAKQTDAQSGNQVGSQEGHGDS